MTSPWDPSRTEYAELLVDQPRFRVEQLWKGLYERGLEPTEISTLPAALRDQLAASHAPSLVPAARQETADGMTVKRLWELDDGARIESVLMHYPERSTVCISSQAGCAMGCGFCATGQAGYERHLTVGEILEQVVVARREAEPRRLSNIVYMGMGEPFANFDTVVESIERIMGDIGIGARHITVSTVGLIPQIRRFTALGWQVGLAVSLHAANDELRSELVPINRRHPIDDLVDACQEFRCRRTGEDRTPSRRSRQPHPPQPDARLAHHRHTASTDSPVRAGACQPRGERHGARQSRHRHRRRLWPAASESRGHTGQARTASHGSARRSGLTHSSRSAHTSAPARRGPYWRAMYRWFNPSHPQTLMTAVFLGYFAAVFGLLGAGTQDAGLNLLSSIAMGLGAFGTANNKRIGYYLLGAASVIRVLLILALLRYGLDLKQLLMLVVNSLVFPVALVAAVFHPHSREYQRVWFS